MKLTETVDKISLQQHEMVSKNDFKNALKENFEEMQKQLSSDTKLLVTTAVDPIQNQMYEIKARLEKVENQSSSNPNIGGSASSPVELNSETQTLLQNQITVLQNKIVERSVQKHPNSSTWYGQKMWWSR